MKIVADEGVDVQIVALLRREGHQVWYVAEMQPGTPDDAVLELANRVGALLLTADKDFGELVFRQHRLTPGVILLRLAGITPTSKAVIVADAIREHAQEYRDAFAVIAPRSIRVRRQM